LLEVGLGLVRVRVIRVRVIRVRVRVRFMARVCLVRVKFRVRVRVRVKVRVRTRVRVWVNTANFFLEELQEARAVLMYNFSCNVLRISYVATITRKKCRTPSLFPSVCLNSLLVYHKNLQ
jgi:hypothetical protein